MITMASLGASEFTLPPFCAADLSDFRVPKPEDAEIKNSTANCKAGVGVQVLDISVFINGFNNLLTFVE